LPGEFSSRIEIDSGAASPSPSDDLEIDRIIRSPGGVKIMMSTGEIKEFDRVVFATPPDRVMALLANPTVAETKRFSDWKANHVTSVVHKDAAMSDLFGIMTGLT
jgi:uncharacterized protein